MCVFSFTCFTPLVCILDHLSGFNLLRYPNIPGKNVFGNLRAMVEYSAQVPWKEGLTYFDAITEQIIPVDNSLEMDCLVRDMTVLSTSILLFSNRHINLFHNEKAISPVTEADLLPVLQVIKNLKRGDTMERIKVARNVEQIYSAWTLNKYYNSPNSLHPSNLHSPLSVNLVTSLLILANLEPMVNYSNLTTKAIFKETNNATWSKELVHLNGNWPNEEIVHGNGFSYFRDILAMNFFYNMPKDKSKRIDFTFISIGIRNILNTAYSSNEEKSITFEIKKYADIDPGMRNYAEISIVFTLVE